MPFAMVDAADLMESVARFSRSSLEAQKGSFTSTIDVQINAVHWNECERREGNERLCLYHDE
jgi:hypothetical protein